MAPLDSTVTAELEQVEHPVRPEPVTPQHEPEVQAAQAPLTPQERRELLAEKLRALDQMIFLQSGCDYHLGAYRTLASIVASDPRLSLRPDGTHFEMPEDAPAGDLYKQVDNFRTVEYGLMSLLGLDERQLHHLACHCAYNDGSNYESMVHSRRMAVRLGEF